MSPHDNPVFALLQEGDAAALAVEQARAAYLTAKQALDKAQVDLTDVCAKADAIDGLSSRKLKKILQDRLDALKAAGLTPAMPEEAPKQKRRGRPPKQRQDNATDTASPTAPETKGETKAEAPVTSDAEVESQAQTEAPAEAGPDAEAPVVADVGDVDITDIEIPDSDLEELEGLGDDIDLASGTSGAAAHKKSFGVAFGKPAA